MSLLIALPFLLSSFLIGILFKKDHTKKRYNRFIYLALLIACFAGSILTQTISIEQSSFIGALSLFYASSLFEHKYLKKTLEVLGFAIAFAGSYLTGISLEYLAITALLTIVIYMTSNQYKSDLVFLALQLIPVGIVGLYLANTNAIYALTLMTFLGSIRYFIEAKSNTTNPFFINAFLLILINLMVSLSGLEFINNIIIIIAGFSFIIFSRVVQTLTRNKQTILQRIYNFNMLKIVPVLKLFIFNLYAIAIAFVYKLGFINIIVTLCLILVVLLALLFKLWYDENEHKL